MHLFYSLGQKNTLSLPGPPYRTGAGAGTGTVTRTSKAVARVLQPKAPTAVLVEESSSAGEESVLNMASDESVPLAVYHEQRKTKHVSNVSSIPCLAARTWTS